MVDREDSLSSAGPRLVGRDEEIARLVRGLRPGSAGAGQAVVLCGPVGIGKTSLLAAALRQCAAEGATVCAVAGTADGVETEFGVVKALFEQFHAAGGPAPSAVDATGDSAYVLIEYFFSWAATASGQGGLVLAVDDAHWCDESSAQWLAFLMRRAGNLPLRLLLTRRSGAPCHAVEPISEIEALYGTDVFDIGPLSPLAVGELVESAVGHPVGELLVRQCAEESGGNPLLLNGVLTELRKSADGSLPFVDSGAGPHLARSMFAGLPEYAHTVATAIAVLGKEDLTLVAQLAGVPSRTAAAAADILRTHRILVSGGLEFRHDPLRAGLLADLPAAELVKLRCLAATLLNDAADSPEEVAEQLLALPVLDEPWMVEVLRDAARSAEDRAAPWAAVRYLRPAVEADPGDTGLAVQFAESVAQLEPSSGFQLLQQVLEKLDEPREYARISIRLGKLALVVRQCGEAAQALENALVRLDEAGDETELRATVEATLYLVGIEDRNTLPSLRTRLRTLDVPTHQSAGEGERLAVHAIVHALRGEDASTTTDWALRAIRTYDMTADDSPVSAACLALMLTDENDSARDELTRAIDTVQASRSEYVALRALLWHWCGDLGEAVSDAENARDLARREDGRSGAIVPKMALATVLTQLGEVEEAEEVLLGVEGRGLHEHTVAYPWFLQVSARARWILGDEEEALRLLRRCGDSLTESGIVNPIVAPWWFDGACLLGGLGRYREAAEIAEAGVAASLRWGTSRAVGMAQLAVAVSTEGDNRLPLVEEAVQTLAGSPARLEASTAEYLLGKELIDRGDRSGARASFHRTATMCVRTGDRLLLQRARRALSESGGRVHRGASSPLASLSPSERLIAGLAGRGVSNRAIAARLFITMRTVETHLTSVYRKLEIEGRAELAAVLGPGQDTDVPLVVAGSAR